jgi:hypothetical protein
VTIQDAGREARARRSVGMSVEREGAQAKVT